MGRRNLFLFTVSHYAALVAWSSLCRPQTLRDSPEWWGLKACTTPPYPAKKDLTWESASRGLTFQEVCRTFSWLIFEEGRAHCGWSCPQQVAQGGLSKQTEQAVGSTLVSSSPLWLPVQLLPPSACRWVPALSSLSGRLWCGSVLWSGNKPLPPQVDFVYGDFTAAMETLSRGWDELGRWCTQWKRRLITSSELLLVYVRLWCLLVGRWLTCMRTRGWCGKNQDLRLFLCVSMSQTLQDKKFTISAPPHLCIPPFLLLSLSLPSPFRLENPPCCLALVVLIYTFINCYVGSWTQELPQC